MGLDRAAPAASASANRSPGGRQGSTAEISADTWPERGDQKGFAPWGTGLQGARNHRRRGPFDKAACRQRNQVERFLARIRQFRRMATLYEKLPLHDLAIGTPAAVGSWLRELA